MTDRADVLLVVCELLASGRIVDATSTLNADYPCSQLSTPRKPWALKRLVRVFLRDGHTDRYSGQRLVFPGTLRALSLLLEEAFPFHPNWKQSETHPAFWELYPTIDHVVPVARGGADDESNIVTTSMVRNSAKSNWLLDEVGWSAELSPVAVGWDGLTGWFDRMTAHDRLRDDRVVNQWRKALRDAHVALAG
jgi:hypothetical protein